MSPSLLMIKVFTNKGKVLPLSVSFSLGFVSQAIVLHMDLGVFERVFKSPLALIGSFTEQSSQSPPKIAAKVCRLYKCWLLIVLIKLM